MNENRLEINEILLFPTLGFRVSGGSNELYSYIEENESISSLDLLYQGDIGFTINAKDRDDFINILKELDKYIYSEYEDNLLETINVNIDYIKYLQK